jgi:murein DD-endopeptidase MepM/ murein hydrolase activator NlpD
MGDRFRMAARMRRWFRRREIFIRGEERIHYIVISPALQMAAAACAVSFLMLGCSGLLGAAFYRDAASIRAEALHQARADYFDLLQSLDALSQKLDGAHATEAATAGAMVRDILREEMQKFRALFPDPDSEQGALRTLATRLMPRAVPDDLLLADAHIQLVNRMHAAERETARLAARERELAAELANARGLLAMSAGEHLQQLADNDALSGRITTLDRQLAADEERNEHIGADLMVAQLELEEENERFESVEADRRSLQAKVAELEGQIASYESVQATWLLALGVRTQDSISLVESAVAMTGVNVEKLVRRAQEELRSAAGGPFVAVVSDGSGLTDGVGSIASDVGEQVERWEALKLLVRALPLSAPLDQYQIASRFGKRTDPFNGRRAMHTGVDFNAPVKTAVLSTAPGRVVHAGWHGEYGRLVEIDHGFGIRTRYAHLAEICVKAGEQVANRAQIGALGSSGRSTGPHLHYEVLIDGRPMNPLNFLEAARHVLKG